VNFWRGLKFKSDPRKTTEQLTGFQAATAQALSAHELSWQRRWAEERERSQSVSQCITYTAAAGCSLSVCVYCVSLGWYKKQVAEKFPRVPFRARSFFPDHTEFVYNAALKRGIN